MLAVHSFKDLPTKSPAELTIAAVPAARRSRRPAARAPRRVGWRAADAWLPLKPGARVGTASARRRAWLTHFRPDLAHRAAARQRADARAQPRRRQLRRDRARGRRRRALASRAAPRQRPRRTSPCCGSTRSASCRRRRKARSPCNAGATTRACSQRSHSIDHAPSRAAVTAERDALARAEGGCDVAFGAYCVAERRRSTSLIAMLERGGAVHVARVAARIPRRSAPPSGRSSTAAAGHDAARRSGREPPRLADAQRRGLRRVGRAARAARQRLRSRCRAFAASRSRRPALQRSSRRRCRAPTGSCSRRAAASRHSRRCTARAAPRSAASPSSARRRPKRRAPCSAASMSSAAARPPRSPRRSSTSAT